MRRDLKRDFTDPRVQGVGRCRGGVEHNVGISGEEVSIELSWNGF